MDTDNPRTMTYTMGCLCGHEEQVREEDTLMGSVWLCPACGTYSACVRTRDGRREWVLLDRSFAEFKRVCQPHEDEDED